MIKARVRLSEALSGNKEAMQWLDDHAQARTGRLYDVLINVSISMILLAYISINIIYR
jgi:hypothetical protein